MCVWRASRAAHIQWPASTAVLIAGRALKDEELWLNYKLSGPLEADSWYTPVVAAAAAATEAGG